MNASPPGFSPELAYLISLTQAALGHSPAPTAPPEIRWPQFLLLVERHRLAPLLQRTEASVLARDAPPPVAEKISRSAAATVQRALAQAALQFDLTRQLEAAGIDVLTVKGVVLAQQLHGGPGGRHVGDIDLVVAPADVAPADALLRRNGFARTRPNFDLTPRQTAAYRRLKPEYEYVHPVSRVRLELLWRLEGLPDLAELKSRAIVCGVAGRTLRTIAAADNILYLFQHGARHGWFRLFWLVDVARLLRSPDIDWAALAARARRDGHLRALQQGAALAGQLLAAPLPTALAAPSPRERRTTASLFAEAGRQIARPVSSRETTAEWFRQAIYRARTQDTARRQFAMLAPHFSSPLNWQTLRLPDRWFFLYFPLSPLLWAWRAARRGGWSR